MQIKVRIDRRAEIADEVRSELEDLGATVQGLTVALVDREAFEAARDAGKFRDFVELATLAHDSDDVLEWVAEELVDRFGWLIDVTK